MPKIPTARAICLSVGAKAMCFRRLPPAQKSDIGKTKSENSMVLCALRTAERSYFMRIAVPFENGQIFQHFGHTEKFKIYEIENGAVASAAVMNTNGSGHGALAGLLGNLGVEVLICGGIGGGAQSALAQVGIKIFGGVSGSADEAVASYLSGSLAYDPNAKCDHHSHEHGEGHTCGEHGCGSHSCGSH